MNKQQVFQHYCDMLDDMREESLVFQNFLIHPVGEIEHLEFRWSTVECGATRAAVIDSGYPYIVKFDIETDMRGDSSSEREVEIYKEAKLCGLDGCFTEAEYLGDYCRTIYSYNLGDELYEMDDDEYMMLVEKEGLVKEEYVITIPLYGYARATCDISINTNYTPEQYTEVEHANSPLASRNWKIALKFLIDYGTDIFERLTDFCLTFNINDLHGGNIGYINDKIVLIDFGSYYSEEDLDPSDNNN